MKAILIVDMPKSCSECPLFNSDFYACQLVFAELYEEVRKGIRHENCPLKPLPKHVIDRNKFAIENKYMNYQDGFNACLDEILGEEE